ncbi:hypothetical protein LJC55_04335, partial [Eubacteriales bacterium OttesenSCG-928-N14]|nr:hypothetical protein [Eubacteriales bacterium OttesenSCG-928-N14]
NQGSAQQINTNGAYSFRVKPGEYQVVFTQGSWRITNSDTNLSVVETGEIATRTATWAVPYTTAAAANVTARDYYVSIYSSITGKAWVDIDANAAHADTESAKTDAVVQLRYVEGAYSQWFSDTHGSYYQVSVQADATYAFNDLWPGKYLVTLVGSDLDDYLRTNISTNSDIIAVTGQDKQWHVMIRSCTSVEQVNFGLIQPSSLSGGIWNDANNDGLMENESYAGTVTITRTATGNMKGYTHTTSAGNFSLTGLLPGEYTIVSDLNSTYLRTYLQTQLTCTGTGSATITADATNPKKFTVTITDTSGEGVAVSNAVAGYALQSTIDGVVFDDIDNDDVKDTGENAISPATITLRKRNAAGDDYDASFTARVSTANTFSFTGLLPGKYEIALSNIHTKYLTTTADEKTVTVDANAHAVFDQATRTWLITIASDGKTVTVNTGVVEQKSITGTVWRDIDGSATYNNTEPFFEDTAPQLRLYQDYAGTKKLILGPVSANTTTGVYSFSGLYPGSYTIELTRPASDSSAYYATNSGATEGTSVITREVTISTANITGEHFPLARTISITGNVWLDLDTSGANGTYDTGDAMQEEAQVRIVKVGGGYDQTVETDSYGNYAVSGLAPGAYTVTLVDSDYSAYVVTNSIWDDEAAYESDSDTAKPNGGVALNHTNKQWTITRYDGYAQQKIDFALSNKSIIVVDVWNDADANGIKATTEDMMQDITITIKKQNPLNSSWEVVSPANTMTNEHGGVVLTDVDTGSYVAEITLGSAWGVTNVANSGISIPISITKHGTTGTASFGIAQYV